MTNTELQIKNIVYEEFSKLISTIEVDVIFDPFMGVGSTGVAAKELNRDFIGYEIDPIFYEAAKKRTEEVK